MKKIALFLVMFVFVFGLFITNVNKASALSIIEGCRAGDLYNRFTGEKCGQAYTYPCQPGEKYNSQTGERCTTKEEEPKGEVVPVCVETLPFGTQGVAVVQLQQTLQEKGYYSGKIDGKYGPKTSTAVARYSTAYPCPPTPISSVVITGVSGPQTLKINQEGTWKVSAYDRDGGDLTYGVIWGDERPVAYPLTDGVSVARAMQQSATFTHKYSQAGTYTPRFTVTNDAGQTAETSLSVQVGGVILNPNITVLSPNGGETWKQGTTQYIKWKDNSPTPTCMVGWPCPDPYVYDITLDSYPNSTSYEIANDVYGYGASYKWNIDVPVGTYTMRVCRSNGSDCDSSDSYFKITSGLATNTPPEITTSTMSAGSLVTGTPIYFSWSATDKDNDNLSWNVNWGDSDLSSGGGCAVTRNIHNGTGRGWSFSTSHTYERSGRYTATVYVNDCYGGSDSQSFDVEVGAIVINPTLLGDVDGNGTITCTDYNMIVQSVSGAITLTAEQKTRADINGNGSVTAYDASLLAQNNNLSCSAIPISRACNASIYWGNDSADSQGAVSYGSSAKETWSVQGADQVWGDCGDGAKQISTGPQSYTFTNMIQDRTCRVWGVIGNNQNACSASATINVLYGDSNAPVLGATAFTFTQRLQLGSTGNEVIELQKYLNSKGYNAGNADGKFGLNTMVAVGRFQMANGLKADGIVGTEVRALLNK